MFVIFVQTSYTTQYIWSLGMASLIFIYLWAKSLYNVIVVLAGNENKHHLVMYMLVISHREVLHLQINYKFQLMETGFSDIICF